MDFFSVFFALIWIIVGCCVYLAISFTRDQVEKKEKSPDSPLEYRADQILCIWIAILSFWGLLAYSIYTIMDMLLK